MGNLVRLLGFPPLACGCIIGRYRELPTNRDVNYVEEKGHSCESHSHRRNHTIAERLSSPVLTARRPAQFPHAGRDHVAPHTRAAAYTRWITAANPRFLSESQ